MQQELITGSRVSLTAPALLPSAPIFMLPHQSAQWIALADPIARNQASALPSDCNAELLREHTPLHQAQAECAQAAWPHGHHALISAGRPLLTPGCQHQERQAGAWSLVNNLLASQCREHGGPLA